METIVLVTGAWHGGWSSRRVATRLRAAGHRVLTPTLPGTDLGADRRGITLTDSGDAVVDIEREDLTDVTLLGHSWGGYVVPGTAPRLAPRLKRTVFWSAFVPQDGESPPGEWGSDRFPGRLDDAVVIDTPGSHEANFTRPAELADAILRTVST